MSEPPDPPQPTPKRKSWLRRNVMTIVSIAVVIVVFGYVLPRQANYGDVLDLLRGLSTVDLGLLVVVAIFNVVTFAPPWMAALPRLSFGHALVMTQATTAFSTAVPGGDAVGLGLSYRMLTVWGFERPAVALALILTAAWNVIANVLLPAIAIGSLAITGETSALLRWTAIIGVAALIFVSIGVVLSLRDDAGARRVGRWSARAAQRPMAWLRRGQPGEWDVALVEFRNRSVGVVRRRWLALTGASLLGHLSVFLVLWVVIRVLDVQGVTWVEAFAAWGFIRLVTTIPITPSGVGIVEAGLSGLLVAFGAGRDEAVAAVLLYRVLTLVPPVAIGGICALAWQRMHPAAGAAAASSDGPPPAA